MSVLVPLGTASATSINVWCFATGLAAGSACFWDCVQLEPASRTQERTITAPYDLSGYFDGDERGCYWTSWPHLSTSVRPLDCRTSGVEDSLAGYMTYSSMTGWGNSAPTNVVLPRGLQGGEVYQRTLKGARTGYITGQIIPSSGQGMDALHSAEGSLAKLLSPDLSYPQRPITLVYDSGHAGGKELEVEAVYEAGLEFSSLDGLTLTSVPLRFHCPDPYLRERLETSAACASSAQPHTASAFYRSPADMGGFTPIGAHGIAGIYCGAYVSYPVAGSGRAMGQQELWLGGDFTSFDGASAHGLAQVNTVNLAHGPATVSGWTYGNVLDICQAGFSDYVWLAAAGLKRVQLSTQAITTPVSISTGVQCLAYDPGQDALYVGGNTGGGSPVPVVTMITGASGGSLTTTTLESIGVTGYMVWDLVVGDDGTLYVVTISGDWTQGGVYSYNASGWTQIGWFAKFGGSPGYPGRHQLLWAPDGRLYHAGSYSAIGPTSGAQTTAPGLARWNGVGWEPLGLESLGPAQPSSIAVDHDGVLHVAGQLSYGANPNAPTMVGAVAASGPGYAVLDGTTLRAELLETGATYADIYHTPLVLANPRDGSVFVACNDDRPSPLATYVQPTALQYTGTAPAPLRVVIQASLNQTPIGGLRNERTGQGVYFRGLVLAPGEVLTIDTDPACAGVFSDRRGSLARYLAPGSGLSSFVLLPGQNYLSVLHGVPYGGVNPNGAACTAYWFNYHTGIDGAGTSIENLQFVST